MRECGWNFDNSYKSLPGIFHSEVQPTPVSYPELVIFNSPLAQELGLNPDLLQDREGVEIFAGNRLPPGAVPLAQAYAGHQFGYFTMLGDGRALLLGEQITQGERYDIQLKGGGVTPYSRGGDGRASLGPMLREYIISEAMHALGIPTSRSLAVVTTGEVVYREAELPGAILTRVASSHIRIGTFQYAAKWGSTEDLRALADYTLQRHFPNCDADHPYLYLLQQVVKHQAGLIAQWQLVGFIHGVMNTDNMFISGETLDYGPCAFMDSYDPETVFSSIDAHGRYAYGNQPRIAAWNLKKFAQTLFPLLDDDQERAAQLAAASVEEFTELYQCNWLRGMGAKLGLFNPEEKERNMFAELLEMMHQSGADYTNTFCALTLNELEEDMFKTLEFRDWHRRWQARLQQQAQSQSASLELMRNSNPALIPRNHRVEEALAAALTGDYGVMNQLLDVLAKPYAYLPEQEEYAQLPPPSPIPYRTYCGT